MKIILAVLVLSAAGWAQGGGVIPAPDIAGDMARMNEQASNARVQAAQTALIRQQTKLMKQQAEALRQQNAAAQQAAATPAPAIPAPVTTASNQFISPIRKPKIDDIDAATGKPRFATYGEFEDGKDEWLIEEAVRRFEALHPAK